MAGELSEAAKENIAKLKEIDKKIILPAMAEHAEKLKEVNIQQPTKKSKGGYVKAADGIAQRGKTKGKMV